MDFSLLVLILFGFIFSGSLPALFFQHGAQKNIKWFLSCIPFFTLPCLVIFNFITSDPTLISLPIWLELTFVVAAVICSISSMLFIVWTVSSHNTPIPLWHQETHQLPESLVTKGPYHYIRHPFYAAYLLLFASCFFAWPHPATLILLVWGFIANFLTANQEEKTILTTSMSQEYEEYQRKTGMFFPRISQ